MEVFWGFDKYDYRQLKVYYNSMTSSEYKMWFISQHEFQLTNKEGIEMTFYRRSWAPGETVELAPSAANLLFDFLGKVLFDDSLQSEGSFDRNQREAQRAKENAFEEHRRN